MISDYLKAKLASEIPGILTATSHLEGGKQVIRINGASAIVGPFASDNEIEAGIRRALWNEALDGPYHVPALPDGNVAGVRMPPATFTLLPPVNITEPQPMDESASKPETVADRPVARGSSAIGYTPGALRSLLQGVRDRTNAVVSGAVEDVKDLHKVLDHVENVAGDARRTASDIRSELGLVTNFPDDDEPKA